MKPTLLEEELPPCSLYWEPVLATHIIWLKCSLKCQEESAVKGYALKPGVRHAVVTAVLEVCPYVF